MHFQRTTFKNSTKPQTVWDIKKHIPTSKKNPQKILQHLPAPNPCDPKLTGRLTSQLSSQRALTTSVKPWLTATYRAVHLALFSRSALAPLASSTRATSAWLLHEKQGESQIRVSPVHRLNSSFLQSNRAHKSILSASPHLLSGLKKTHMQENLSNLCSLL